MLNNFDIERGFIKEEEIDKLLYDFQCRMNVVDDGDYDEKVRMKLYRGVNQVCATRLRIAFQRQIQLDWKEAYEFYNSHIETLLDRLKLFYDILDKLNDMGITYIPDKLTLCSFLRVGADTFDMLMTDAQVEIEVQKVFRELNEFILSLTQIGLETGALNSYAWQRLQLKTKFGGHEISKPETERKEQMVIVSGDIQRKLASDYDFTKMIAESESTKEKKEG